MYTFYIVGYVMAAIVGLLVFLAKRQGREDERMHRNNKD